MHNTILWCGGKGVLKGAVTKRYYIGQRPLVDVVFEDGRWFNKIPAKALAMNSNWVESEETIDIETIQEWKNLGGNRERFIYCASVTISKSDNGYINSKLMRRSPVIIASDFNEAEKSIREHYGNDNVHDIEGLKLSDCQLAPMWHDIIQTQ